MTRKILLIWKSIRPTLVKPDEPFDYYEISEADLQEDTDHE